MKMAIIKEAEEIAGRKYIHIENIRLLQTRIYFFISTAAEKLIKEFQAMCNTK
jgi:hypothetical protein